MRIAGLIVGMTLFGSLCLGQESTKSLEKQVKGRSVQNGPWVLRKHNLNDFTTSGQEDLGTFSEENAKLEAKKLNDALKGADANRWFYSAVPNTDPPTAEPQGGSPPVGVITNPKLSIVVPGGSANSQPKKRSPLIGKIGIGKVGGSEATIRFQEDGKVVFGGKVSGSATLDEAADGVKFSSENADYEGSLDGKRIFGKRYAKDRSGKRIPNGVVEWDFTLQDDSPPMEKGKAYNAPAIENTLPTDLEGAWEDDYYRSDMSYRFKNDGKVEMAYKGTSVDGGVVTWSRSNNTVTVKGGNWQFQGTIQGGTIRGTKYSQLQGEKPQEPMSWTRTK